MPKKTKNYADVIHKQISNDPVLADAVDNARITADIAEVIYNARIDIKITRSELAKRVGCKVSVIKELEEDNWMPNINIDLLRKIAFVLGRQLQIRFCER